MAYGHMGTPKVLSFGARHMPQYHPMSDAEFDQLLLDIEENMVAIERAFNPAQSVNDCPPKGVNGESLAVTAPGSLGLRVGIRSLAPDACPTCPVPMDTDHECNWPRCAYESDESSSRTSTHLNPLGAVGRDDSAQFLAAVFSSCGVVKTSKAARISPMAATRQMPQNVIALMVISGFKVTSPCLDSMGRVGGC